MASAGGTVRPAPGSQFDTTSLVAARVEVRDPDTGQSVRRLPRRVVPLHKDDLLGVYVETERLLLAEDAVLFVKDDAALVKATRDLLDHLWPVRPRLRPDRARRLRPPGWRPGGVGALRRRADAALARRTVTHAEAERPDSA